MLTPDETVYGDLTTWAPAPFGSLFADANYCGRSFDRGLLRFHNAESGAEAQELVTAAFTATSPPAQPSSPSTGSAVSSAHGPHDPAKVTASPSS